jgi:hypothetical protein
MKSEYDLSNFKFPDTYVSSAAVASNIADAIQNSSKEYWEYVDKVLAHIDGQKPIDPIKLKKAGLSWSNNWNYFKATGKIQRGTLENVARIRKALLLSTVSFRRAKEEDEKKKNLFFLSSDEMRGVYASKIARVFIDTIEREPRFNDFLNTTEFNAHTFGWCPVTLCDRDWMGVAHLVSEVGFPDKTLPDEIERYAIYDNLRGRFLWEKWVKIKKSSFLQGKRKENGEQGHNTFYNGWCLEGLEEALYFTYQGELGEGTESGRGQRFEYGTPSFQKQFGKLCNKFISNPSLTCELTDKVNIAKIYNFEFSKEVAKLTITYIAYQNNWSTNANSGKSGGSYAAKHILFQKTLTVDSQDDVINIIKESGFSPTGFIQDLSGISKPLIPDSVRFNRKNNNIENKLLFAGSPYFRSVSGQGAETLRIVPTQGFIIANENLVLDPTQPRFDLSQHILSLNMDEKNFMRDTSHFDPRLDNLTSRPNKDEVKVKSAEVSRTNDARNDVKIGSYQRLMLNQFKSLRDKNFKPTHKGHTGKEYFYSELEYEFREEKFKREEIKEILQAVNDFTLEYIIEDISALQTLATLVETPYARKRLQRMIAITLGTPRTELDRLFPIVTDNYRNLSDNRVAAIENDMLLESSEVVYSESDDPIVHLDMHYSKFSRVLEQIKVGGGDPVMLFNYLTRLLDHSKLHLQKIETHAFYKRYFAQYSDIYSKFLKILSSLLPQIQALAKRIAEEKQNAQQGQQGQNEIPEAERQKINIEWFKAVKKEEINKVRSDERAAQKAKEKEFTRQQKIADQEFSQKLKSQQADFDMQLRAFKEASSSLT